MASIIDKFNEDQLEQRLHDMYKQGRFDYRMELLEKIDKKIDLAISDDYKEGLFALKYLIEE